MIRAILIACLLVSSASAETARRVPIQSVNIDAREFGVRTGDGVDNADALERLHDYLKASDIRHVVTFPPGLVQSSYTWWLSDLGSPGVIIDAYGTQFQSSSEDAQSLLQYPLSVVAWFQTDARRSAGSGIVSSAFQNYGYKIDTASAGTRTVTLQTPAEASNFSAGDTVCIHGLDQQQTGTPRNPKFFEYAEVESIDGANITLVQSLNNTYHQSWHEVTVNSVTIGAPRIAPTSHTNNDTTAYVEVRGAEFLQSTETPGDNGQPALYALETVMVDCKGTDCFVSTGRSATLRNCRFTAGTEPDKLLDLFRVEGGRFGGHETTLPMGGGTGVNRMEVIGARISGTMSSLTPRRLYMRGCTLAPRPADTAILYFDSNWSLADLELRDNSFIYGSAMARPSVAENGSGPRSFTTTATGANHGAGQFAIAENNTGALNGLQIGGPVWEEDGAARGRVVAITHDGSGEYLVTVDTGDTFTASTKIYYPTVVNARHSGNACNSVRQAIVGIHERDVSQQSRVIRITDRQVYMDSTSYTNRLWVGGTINKIRCNVERATGTGGKQLVIGSQEDSDGTFEGGFMRFALTATGDRYLSDEGSTLLSSDVLTTSPYCIGWCGWLQLGCNFVGVDTDDLPKFTLEIYVDQTAEATDNGETVTAASPTLSTTRASKLDSTSNAITATLGSGDYVGQIKTIVMTNASNSSTVSVTNHVTSDPEVFTFDAVDEYLVLMWTGTEWVTVAGDATTALVNPWYGTLAAAEHPATYLEAVPCLAA